MNPVFALTFSAQGVALLHHADGDWFTVGMATLDGPDLAEQMQGLRNKGFALANDLSCKIVLPADQVKYLSLPTEGMTEEQAAQAIQEALSDATPYSLDQLSYDTRTEGANSYVAAVAKQTLEEARSFATDYGFLPVLYTAETAQAEFPSEPVFTFSAPETPPVHAPVPEDAPVAAEEEPVDTSPPTPEDTAVAHAIAEPAQPDSFVSPERADAGANRQPAPRGLAFAAAAAAVLGLGAAWWFLTAQTDQQPQTAAITADDVVDLPEQQDADPQSADQTNAVADIPLPQPEPVIEDVQDQPPTATDKAILEALNTAPQTVEPIARDTATQDAALAQSGLVVSAPLAPEVPVNPPLGDLYLASVDNTNLSNDAIAIPTIESFATDTPFEYEGQARLEGVRFELDERGLVTPTREGTLNPDGVMVFLGRPSSVPPAVPVRFEQEPVLEEVDDRLAGFRPRLRPDNLIEQLERQQFGGRSLEELSIVRPKLRPASLQVQPQVDDTPTALAVVRVPRPKPRPPGLKPVAAKTNGGANLGSTAALNSGGGETGTFQPKAVSPKIPTTASVARQATIDNALNLRRLNLIGVYGTPANRRALVRLPSGRYKKLKVGDRIDGGKVIAISDSELRYQKSGRNLTISMPRG